MYPWPVFRIRQGYPSESFWRVFLWLFAKDELGQNCSLGSIRGRFGECIGEGSLSRYPVVKERVM